MPALRQQCWEGLEEQQKPLYGPSCFFPVIKSTESFLDKSCSKSKAEPQPGALLGCALTSWTAQMGCDTGGDGM